MTDREKINRYDALQAAIKATIGSFEVRKGESDKRAGHNNVIEAYEKGLADAYAVMIETLGRWKDEG